jgi:hypothetical protein
MRRKIFVCLIAALFLSPSITFAQSTLEQKEPAADEGKKDKQAKNEQMASMIMGMMGMMQKQMVSSNDGGVIILQGNKLIKYDKDLNLVKIVEVKASIEPSQK